MEMNSAAQAEMIDNQDAALGDEITVWPLDACSMLWLAGTADESVRYRGCGAMSRRLYGVVVCLLICYLSVISSAMRIRDQVGDVPVLVPVQQQQTHMCCWLMFWANMHISADRLLVLPPEALAAIETRRDARRIGDLTKNLSRMLFRSLQLAGSGDAPGVAADLPWGGRRGHITATSSRM